MLDGATTSPNWSRFLALLPALTHVSLRSVRVATALLASCKKLEVLICMRHEPVSSLALFSPIDAHRVVWMWRDLVDVENWLTGTKGGKDYWARADAFVAKKDVETSYLVRVVGLKREMGLDARLGSNLSEQFNTTRWWCRATQLDIYRVLQLKHFSVRLSQASSR
ncbi:hypothetical protein B0H19DRAFT_1374851 [Mycena capillaripes]|nr:hypothetical protein B0H19DRAFT_1374851 [Mycena capillaripes]